MANPKKQAVLLIHGIGEQRPMDTLRGFVDSVWTTDTSVHHPHAATGTFSKPDDVSGNYELRRLTTTKNRNEVRTDFFEFYWAYLMDDTSVNHVTAWARQLLIRWPWNLPKRLRGVWILLVVLILVVAFFAVQTVVPESFRLVTVPKWMTGLLSILIAGVAVPIVKNVIGDAARYLHPAPTNIRRRQEIRAKGVELLKKLHTSGDYDRIVLVGHSLGSVIGYDILTYAWPEFNTRGDVTPPNPELDAFEKALKQGPLAPEAYQDRQDKLMQELRSNDCPWLVTDFVTLGSPLTHAELLLAEEIEDLRRKQGERELPICPPTPEDGRISYPPKNARRKLHHAAVFGPTRWTNLYFPARWIIRGDLIGGPLRGVFGEGIRDVEVTTAMRRGLLSHTLYWSQSRNGDAGSHIEQLRSAVRLAD